MLQVTPHIFHATWTLPAQSFHRSFLQGFEDLLQDRFKNHGGLFFKPLKNSIDGQTVFWYAEHKSQFDFQFAHRPIHPFAVCGYHGGEPDYFLIINPFLMGCHVTLVRSQKIKVVFIMPNVMAKKRIFVNSRFVEAISPYFYLIPAFSLVGFFLLFPAVQTLFLSFTSWNGISRPAWIGLKNFQRFFTDPIFKVSLLNTLYWAIFSVILPVALGLAAALSISRLQKNNIFKLLLFLPYALSAVSVGIVWSYMFRDSGAINVVLRALKLDMLTHIWLQEVPLNTFSLLIAFTWRMVGVNMVLFLVGLQNIPQEPIEAAKIDGATEGQLIRKIILPMLSSMSTVVVVMAFVNGINAFDVIWVMTNGGPYRSSETLAVTMYRESFILFKLGGGSAVAILLSIIVFGSSIFYIRVVSKKEQF